MIVIQIHHPNYYKMTDTVSYIFHLNNEPLQNFKFFIKKKGAGPSTVNRILSGILEDHMKCKGCFPHKHVDLQGSFSNISYGSKVRSSM